MKKRVLHMPMAVLEAVGRILSDGKKVASSDHVDAYISAMNHVDPANWYPNEPPDKTARKVILSGPTWDERGMAIKHIQRKDTYISTAGHLYMKDMTATAHDDNTYRISVFPDGIDVVCFGLESVDSRLEGHYDRVDDLPGWVKERLAVLNMMSSTPPTNEVEGVGRRISAHVYWVYAPDMSTEASTSA